MDADAKLDFDASREFLDALFKEVCVEESTLSGGIKLGVGGNVLQNLRETRVVFGNPRDNLIKLTGGLFESVGVDLSEIHKQQMRNRFDFYYLTLAISMMPGRGVQFTRAECILDFFPKGEQEPIVQAIFPKSEWKPVLTWGAGMNLGLNGNLEWVAEMDSRDLPTASHEEIPGRLKSNIGGKGEIKAFVIIPDYSFELGRVTVAATGEGGSECRWRIDKPEIQKAQTIRFATVFKVPKGTKSIEIVGRVWVEPSMSWLTANLGDVYDSLRDKVKRLFMMNDEDRKGVDRLPIGDHERWMIELPA